MWKNVHDRDRRDIYEDIIHQLAKKERVRTRDLWRIICYSPVTKSRNMHWHGAKFFNRFFLILLLGVFAASYLKRLCRLPVILPSSLRRHIFQFQSPSMHLKNYWKMQLKLVDYFALPSASGIYIQGGRSRGCLRSCGVRVDVVWSSDSFSSLWAAFTLTVHINALFNESVQRQEQHSSGINTIT